MTNAQQRHLARIQREKDTANQLIDEAVAVGFRHTKVEDPNSLADTRALDAGPIHIEVTFPGLFSFSQTRAIIWTTVHEQRSEGLAAARFAVRYGASLRSRQK